MLKAAAALLCLATPCCALQRVLGVGAHARVQILGAKSHSSACSIGECPSPVLEFMGNWPLTDAQLCRRRLSHRGTVWTAATERIARGAQAVCRPRQQPMTVTQDWIRKSPLQGAEHHGGGKDVVCSV